MNTIGLKPFVILSTADAGQKSAHRIAIDLASYHGGNWRAVEGCYKGVPEDAFLVTLTDSLSLSHIRAIADCNKQESFLVVDEQRRAHLHYCDDGRVEHLGSFVECQPAQAGDAYTIADGRYYHCR